MGDSGSALLAPLGHSRSHRGRHHIVVPQSQPIGEAGAQAVTVDNCRPVDTSPVPFHSSVGDVQVRFLRDVLRSTSHIWGVGPCCRLGAATGTDLRPTFSTWRSDFGVVAQELHKVASAVERIDAHNRRVSVFRFVLVPHDRRSSHLLAVCEWEAIRAGGRRECLG